MNKTSLVAAAITGLMMTSVGCSSTQKGATSSGGDMAQGQCHGVNACKGHGECGGAGHACAGKNSCKGKGWVKMSKADCTEKGGEFKSGGMM